MHKSNITISFPNLLWIPFLSIVYSVIKLYNGVSWNWAVVLVISPLLTYLGWCIGWCLLTYIAMKLFK
jgi:hypothetical protein